jgi:hypothetical protein
MNSNKQGVNHLAGKKKNEQVQSRLKKMQEVTYAREFKRADRAAGRK